MTLNGHVSLTHGESTMVGEHEVMDLQSGVSHLTPGADARVQAYVVPRKQTEGNPAQPEAQAAQQKTQAGEPDAKNAPNASAGGAPAQKAQTDDGKAR